MQWAQYYMYLALLTAQRSKDPNTKVGAVIVNPKGRIVSLGYNGFVETRDLNNDQVFPWTRNGNFLTTKYAYVVHAELNAILNAKTDLTGCSLVVTMAPCNECAKAIAQSGIREVLYLTDPYKDTEWRLAARTILEAADIPEYSLKDLGMNLPSLTLGE